MPNQAVEFLDHHKLEKAKVLTATRDSIPVTNNGWESKRDDLRGKARRRNEVGILMHSLRQAPNPEHYFFANSFVVRSSA